MVKQSQDEFLTNFSKAIGISPDYFNSLPKLINPEYEKDQADPWLVAMLLEIMEQDGMFGEQSNYIMVTTESERSNIKLPAACKHYNIRHMNLFEFFEANELEFSVRKK